MVTIAVVAMGEMGSGIARRLVERGARVVTSISGRSAASIQRAADAGVAPLGDEDIVAQADIFLSIVPPVAAGQTAARYLPLIEASPNKPIFIDCNAIAPQTLKALSADFLTRGLRIGDASIIGLAPRPDGYSPRIYMSGDIAAEAEILSSLGLETRVMSQDLGDASAIKMAYAGITKGLQAIGTAMALGAARAGAADALVEELKDTQPQIYAWLTKTLPVMARKAYRWDDEMCEIAAFLEPEHGAATMLRGAAELYRHVAQDNEIGPQSEIVSVLNRFVGAGQ